MSLYERSSYIHDQQLTRSHNLVIINNYKPLQYSEGYSFNDIFPVNFRPTACITACIKIWKISQFPTNLAWWPVTHSKVMTIEFQISMDRTHPRRQVPSPPKLLTPFTCTINPFDATYYCHMWYDWRYILGLITCCEAGNSCLRILSICTLRTVDLVRACKLDTMTAHGQTNRWLNPGQHHTQGIQNSMRLWKVYLLTVTVYCQWRDPTVSAHRSETWTDGGTLCGVVWS